MWPWIIIVGIGAILYMERKPIQKLVVQTAYSDMASVYASRWSVPLPLVLAVIEQESSGNPLAHGGADDRGLMQITPVALAQFNQSNNAMVTADDLWKPETNIMVGTWTLHWCYDQLHDWTLATQAYNAGVHRVQTNPLAGAQYAAQVLD